MTFCRTAAIALAVALTFSGCEERDPVADEANDTAGLLATDNVAAARSPSAHGSAPINAAATPALPASSPAAAIPAALRGRWGLTPADCTSTRGDAKGLLVISGDRLSFYESRAVPTRNVQVSADSISADFAFTGEGQTWNRYEALRLEDGKLVRTESSPMASFTYVRCR